MSPARTLIAYRQTHDQTNTAAVLIAALAEFGVVSFDVGKPRQELVLHGLIQRGPYQEGRGNTLANALRYLFDRGVHRQVLCDAKRAGALYDRIRGANPEFEMQLVNDLGPAAARPVSIEADFTSESLVLLVESRPSVAGLPVHILLARRDGDEIAVMNSDTGLNYRYAPERLSDHLNTPVHFGAVGFAGRQYIYTGLAIRLNTSPS